MKQTRVDGSYQIEIKEGEEIEVPELAKQGIYGYEHQAIAGLIKIWLEGEEPGGRWKLLLSFRRQMGDPAPETIEENTDENMPGH